MTITPTFILPPQGGGEDRKCKSSLKGEEMGKCCKFK